MTASSLYITVILSKTPFFVTTNFYYHLKKDTRANFYLCVNSVQNSSPCEYRFCSVQISMCRV